MRLLTHEDGMIPQKHPQLVWVFGSNQRGFHGAGAALVAVREFGAKPGYGEGFWGNSYGIPTKNYDLKVRSFHEIEASVKKFIRYAYLNPEKMFFLTRVGCGYAGFSDEEIAPLFLKAPKRNCNFPLPWRKFFLEGFYEKDQVREDKAIRGL